MKPTNEMTLVLVGMVFGNGNVRWQQDERRRCDRYVVAYRGDDGHEYRKAFCTKPGVDPLIPTRGTHKELNVMENQVTRTVTATWEPR